MRRLAILLTATACLTSCTKQTDTGSTRPDDVAPVAEPAGGDTGTPVPVEPEPKKDQRTLQAEKCAEGNGEMCTSVGVMWEQGKEGAADVAKAREFYEKGCLANFDLGCSYFASVLDKGVGGPVDAAKARELWTAQCDKGNVDDCLSAANSHEAVGTKADKATARGLYSKACTAGKQGGCSSEARLMMLGEGGAKDQKRARSMFQAACDAGDATGCFNLALAMEKGVGGKKDKAGAVAARAKACEAGNQLACPK